jgi:O-acetyl-ADP-ribose deacetylase (regulator of RNase III)
MITLGKGDLLDARTEALVNTVNTQGTMGKGIALQFKKSFPESFTLYARACKRGEVEVGKMLVYQTARDAPRYVIHFPTKKHWRDPSELSYVRDGLVDLVAQVRAFKIRSIAIPALGCGLGGLPWDDVRPLIEVAFQALDDVDVLLFAPR